MKCKNKLLYQLNAIVHPLAIAYIKLIPITAGGENTECDYSLVQSRLQEILIFWTLVSWMRNNPKLGFPILWKMRRTSVPFRSCCGSSLAPCALSWGHRLQNPEQPGAWKLGPLCSNVRARLRFLFVDKEPWWQILNPKSFKSVHQKVTGIQEECFHWSASILINPFALWNIQIDTRSGITD